jgi:hypothetical protein
VERVPDQDALCMLCWQVMVFFSSCASVKYHAELLNYIDIPVKDIHGKQKQQRRTSTFMDFCKARARAWGTPLCCYAALVPHASRHSELHFATLTIWAGTQVDSWLTCSCPSLCSGLM